MPAGNALERSRNMHDPTEGSGAGRSGFGGLTFSRRDVLRTAGIGGAGLGAAAFLGACGNSNKPSTTGTKVSSAWAKAPVSFVFLDTTEPNTLDPSQESEFDGMLITRNTYDALT